MASAVIALLLLFAAIAAYAAPGMSIISQDESHSADSSWRSDDEVRQLHREWMAKHRRSYGGLGEAESRFEVFKDNLRFIEEHNAAADRGQHTYRLGFTSFTDLTHEEFRAVYTGSLLTPVNLSAMVTSDRYRPVDGLSAPGSVDWRKSGAVAPIRNQGDCASCWAFATVSAVESINQIVDGDLIHLSEQELLDCNTIGQFGCKGGYMDKALQFIIRNNGIASRSDYPYTGKVGRCKQLQRKVVKIDGYEFVESSNENALKNAVANQPVIVGIETVDNREFQHYESGIYRGPCGYKLDHAVVVIGYDNDDGKDYWLVRNSWGTNWGENGYIRMERNVKSREGTCGIAMIPLYPSKMAKVSYSAYA